MPIRVFPDEVLREIAQEVVKFDDDLGLLLDNMAETMYSAHGIGLAANQVGVLQRVVVVDVSESRQDRLELINPRILDAKGKTSSEEGCLSIPDYRDTINRNETITVQAQNRKGEQIDLTAEGLLAICIQHEVDHLNGVLFVDHLSRLKRELFKRWLKKRAIEAKNNAAG